MASLYLSFSSFISYKSLQKGEWMSSVRVERDGFSFTLDGNSSIVSVSCYGRKVSMGQELRSNGQCIFLPYGMMGNVVGIHFPYTTTECPTCKTSPRYHTGQNILEVQFETCRYENEVRRYTTCCLKFKDVLWEEPTVHSSRPQRRRMKILPRVA